MAKCVCGNEATKRLKIPNTKIFHDLCDDCASTVLVDIAKQLDKKGRATVVKFEGTDSGVILGRNKCLRCGHVWTPKSLVPATICPKCKSPYWDKERRF